MRLKPAWHLNLPLSLRAVCDATKDALNCWMEFRDCLLSHERDEASGYPPDLRSYAVILECLRRAKEGQELLSDVGDEFASVGDGPAFDVAGERYLGLSWHDVVLRSLAGVSFGLLEEYSCTRASQHFGYDPDVRWWQLNEPESSIWREMQSAFFKMPFDEGGFGNWIRATINRAGEIMLREQDWQLAVRNACRTEAILSCHEEVSVRLELEAARVGVQRRYANRALSSDFRNDTTEIDFTNLDFNRTEQAIISVLLKAGKRLTTSELLSALAKSGCELSESTIKNALSALVKSEVLDNDPKARPKGYGVLLASPAFRPRSIP